jgi:pimeloyl-ACP methyl ester carboxylesterase
MPRAAANGIEIEYETMGDEDGVPLLLIAGHGAPLLWWDDDFCHSLTDRGFRVIRFDNRDVGLSTKIEVVGFDVMAAISSALADGPIDAPYRLSDMAADGWSLLDALHIDRAHLFGVSMGGMIAQTMAITRPERALSLVSMSSLTGEPGYGAPRPEVLGLLLEQAPSDRAGFVASEVEGTRAVASPDHFDEDLVRRRHERTFDRCYYPQGVGQQLAAMLASGSRDEQLRRLTVPTLVIHGDVDPLVTLSGGEHTAEVVQGAELLILEGLGHDLPVHYWSRIIDAVVGVASRAEAAASEV